MTDTHMSYMSRGYCVDVLLKLRAYINVRAMQATVCIQEGTYWVPHIVHRVVFTHPPCERA